MKRVQRLDTAAVNRRNKTIDQNRVIGLLGNDKRCEQLSSLTSQWYKQIPICFMQIAHSLRNNGKSNLPKGDIPRWGCCMLCKRIFDNIF